MAKLAEIYYRQVSGIRETIDNMVAIMQSDSADDDEKAAAWETVREALFPEPAIEL